MGIGRDRFTAMFGAALGDSGSDAATVCWGDHYINRRLGFALSKPQGWHFANIKDMGRMRSGTILLGDSEVMSELLAACDDPIVTVSKEPITNDVPMYFSPGCTIFLERYDEALDGGQASFLEDEIEGSQAIFRDFCLLSSPRPRIVSGSAALEYGASFLFEHRDLMRPVPVVVRVLSVYQNPALYDIRMYDAPLLGEEFSFNYDSFVASLRFV